MKYEIGRVYKLMYKDRMILSRIIILDYNMIYVVISLDSGQCGIETMEETFCYAWKEDR